MTSLRTGLDRNAMANANAVAVPERAWTGLGMAGLAILGLAAVLRLWGIGHGMPFWIVNDELPLVGGALRMIELKTLVPSLEPRLAILYYPPAIPYLYLVVFTPILALWWIASGFAALSVFSDIVLSNLVPLWLAARMLSACFSVATAYVVMRLASEVTSDRRVGLVAGLAFAVSLHHVLLGHFARVWAYTDFFCWWGLWAAWRIYADGKPRSYTWAAVAAGLGFAVNYIGVLVAAAAGIAHLLRHRRLVIDRPILRFTAIVAAFIVVFTALYWQNLVRLMGYSAMFEFVPRALPPVPGLRLTERFDFTDTFSTFARVFWDTEPVLAVVGAIGLAPLAWRNPRFFAMAAAALGLHLAFVVFGAVSDDRYILPVTVLFMISGAYLVVQAFGRNATALAIGCIVFLGLSSAASVQLDRLLSKPDNRERARAWLLANATAEQGVINLMRWVSLEQTESGLRDQAEVVDAASLTYLQRRRLAGAPVLSGGGGRALKAVDLLQPNDDVFQAMPAQNLFERLLARGYGLVASDDHFGADGREGLLALAKARGTLAARFDPGPPGMFGPQLNQQNQWGRGTVWSIFRTEYLGPPVEIWRVN